MRSTTHDERNPEMNWMPLVVIASGLLLTSCLFNKKSMSQNLSWQKIRAGALVVDARSPREYENGHMQGAVNIPYRELDKHMNKLGGDKTRPIVAYCLSGHRSAAIKEALEAKGYTNVHNAGAYNSLMRNKPY